MAEQFQLRPEEGAGNGGDAAAGDRELPGERREYSLADSPQEDAPVRRRVPRRRQVPAAPARKPWKAPWGVLLRLMVPVLLIAVIECWPENEQDQRRVTGLLALATQAEHLAEQGEYTAAITQYNVFLSVASKSELRVRRLKAAVERAQAAVVRLQSVAKYAARSSTGPASTQTAVAFVIRSATRPATRPR